MTSTIQLTRARAAPLPSPTALRAKLVSVNQPAAQLVFRVVSSNSPVRRTLRGVALLDPTDQPVGVLCRVMLDSDALWFIVRLANGSALAACALGKFVGATVAVESTSRGTRPIGLRLIAAEDAAPTEFDHASLFVVVLPSGRLEERAYAFRRARPLRASVHAQGPTEVPGAPGNFPRANQA